MRILMPIDSSVCSKAAVDFVASRSTLLQTPTNIDLFHLLYPLSIRVRSALGKEVVDAYYEREANEVLKKPEAKLKRAGARTTARHAIGTMDHEFLEAVRKHPADLIVIGSQGERGLSHFIFGSVADKIATACTRPLLILRGEHAPKHADLKVGLAVDGSVYGIAAAKFIARNSALFGKNFTVSLIHVAPELETITVPGLIDRQVKTGILPEQARAMQAAAYDAAFRPAVTILQDAGLSANKVRLVGVDAGEQIAAYAEKNKLDLLVMGSLGYGTNGYSAVGSVANRVASRVRTPLLLIREVDFLEDGVH